MEKWIVYAFTLTVALIDKGSSVVALPLAWAIFGEGMPGAEPLGGGLLVIARG